MVKVTFPAVVSAVLGTYCAAAVVLFGLNVPVPVLVHCTPPAIVEAPLMVMAEALAHLFLSIPAVTVGAGVMVITRLSVTALHKPLPVVIAVRVTVVGVAVVGLSAVEGK